MSDAFERGWSVVKDFYFAPDNPNGGVFFPDELPLPDKEIDVSPFAPDQLNMGKNLKMINMFDENYTFPFSTPDEPFQRGGSQISRPNTPTGTVGVNLGDIAQEVLTEVEPQLKNHQVPVSVIKRIGETKAEGIVTGVNFEKGQTILTVDNKKKVALKDVESFFLPKSHNKQNTVGAKNPQLEKSLKNKANAAYNNFNETNL